MDLKLLARNEKILQLVGFLCLGGAAIAQASDATLIGVGLFVTFGACTFVAYWVANRETPADRIGVEDTETVETPVLSSDTRDKLLLVLFMGGSVLLGVLAVGTALAPESIAAQHPDTTPTEVQTDAIRLGTTAALMGAAGVLYWYFRPDRRVTWFIPVGCLVVLSTLGRLALGLPMRVVDMVALLLIGPLVLVFVGIKVYNRGETA